MNDEPWLDFQFAGAAGPTYDHRSIWQMHSPKYPGVAGPKEYGHDALDAPSAQQMGRLRIPGGHQHFTATSRVRTDPYPVAIQADLDLVTGQLTWLMRSFHPDTGGLPENPLAGFLPPHDATGRGEGTLRFGVRVLPDLDRGTLIKNEAEILSGP